MEFSWTQVDGGHCLQSPWKAINVEVNQWGDSSSMSLLSSRKVIYVERGRVTDWTSNHTVITVEWQKEMDTEAENNFHNILLLKVCLLLMQIQNHGLISDMLCVSFFLLTYCTFHRIVFKSWQRTPTKSRLTFKSMFTLKHIHNCCLEISSSCFRDLFN